MTFNVYCDLKTKQNKPNLSDINNDLCGRTRSHIYDLWQFPQ